MRVAALHFRNVSDAPVRIYLPRGEAFRAAVLSLHLRSGKQLHVEPSPRPHGVVIDEPDFPLLAPGEERVFEQSFTLDPMQPGAGTKTARRPGFEDGKEIEVTLTYENEITRWAGGTETLDGPTRRLFDGKDIPHIWTGQLSTKATWRIR